MDVSLKYKMLPALWLEAFIFYVDHILQAVFYCPN